MQTIKSWLSNAHFKSAVDTFVSAFVLAVLPVVGGVSYSKSAIFALIAVGLRAGIKAITASYATPTQG